MIIYRIKNLINGKSYIGQTTQTLELRWKQHCQKNRKRSCPSISKAIVKYGERGFSLEILEYCNSLEALNEREKYWIGFYNSFGEMGYNLTSGGDTVELSDQSKLKISKALKGKTSNGKLFKSGQSPWNKGIPWSSEMKITFSHAHKDQIPWSKGKKFTDSHRQKLSKSHFGVPNKALNKPIFCTTNGKSYPSCKDAAEELKLSQSKICLVLKGKRNHTGGFKFKYLK